MTFEEYRKQDAVGLAELVKQKQVTPTELLEIAIKRTEEVNPKINAVITPLYDFGKKINFRIKQQQSVLRRAFFIKRS